ncbi:hypothetical protein M569_00462 [Genlisea aurea]|uniref:Uncharacterized protein n=1 Tax=Genlisea aurea TaxID=192259 RepID=S8D9T0_9LAMI|nr:hypothetical protein M569_00462 [Genlisea aurea]
MIDRILCLLAAHGIVACRAVASPHGGVERVYSPAPAPKLLTKSEEGISLALRCYSWLRTPYNSRHGE